MQLRVQKTTNWLRIETELYACFDSQRLFSTLLLLFVYLSHCTEKLFPNIVDKTSLDSEEDTQKETKTTFSTPATVV